MSIATELTPAQIAAVVARVRSVWPDEGRCWSCGYLGSFECDYGPAPEWYIDVGCDNYGSEYEAHLECENADCDEPWTHRGVVISLSGVKELENPSCNKS